MPKLRGSPGSGTAQYGAKVWQCSHVKAGGDSGVPRPRPRRTVCGTVESSGFEMADGPQPKIPLVFFRTATGSEPVREWLRELETVERHAIGLDLLRAQWRWPVGMPLCRPMGGGLWEIRTDLPTKRTSRVLICLCRDHLVALHGFIKKTRRTPESDIAIARKRQKELER